jgi:hypothetical protein
LASIYHIKLFRDCLGGKDKQGIGYRDFLRVVVIHLGKQKDMDFVAEQAKSKSEVGWEFGLGFSI